ncbi:MIP/aquaporin family protein [Bryobacter aggregatus]|uniref:MIP/aquaporin family protein n=1 Tax=Bryobacter aggregatus TaxID=360054 RepID=UPI0004E22225|nr:MIP/aquaporin family protein [Bryobacter aggregatus]
MPGTLLYEATAEFIGTMIIILFGAGVVAMTQLFGTGTPGEIVNGGFTNITLGWGLAVMMGVAVSAKVSGAHLNPAVTISLAIFRGFSWSKVLPYLAAQFTGAFCGAALVYLNYRPAFLAHDPGLESTAGVFSTFPRFPEIPLAGFVDQVIGTALLLFLVLAVTDENNLQAPPWLTPMLVGLIVVAIGMSFGSLHGYAINPARDFGPRLFTAIAGFKHNGLTDGTYVWLIPFFAPILGGIVGTAAYDFTIRKTL